MVPRHVCVFLQVLLIHGCGPLLVHSGRVLIIPGEYSHWHNMRVIVEALVDRNHSVTVLVSSATPTVNVTRSERFKFQQFNVGMQEEDMTVLWDKFVDFFKYQQNGTTSEVFSKSSELLTSFTSYITVVCKGLAGNQTLLESLKQAEYEVILTDPFTPCGDLLAERLGIPFIITMRFTFGLTFERLCGQMPTLPSFVPTCPITATDQMNFSERLANFMKYVVHSAMFLLKTCPHASNVYGEIKGEPSNMCESVGKADLWFIRSHWVWEYPRPFPPNFIYIGGHHCKPAQPLPLDFEDFIQSSGENGIVVFTFGSMFKNLTSNRRDMIVSALGQIPQKVIWGFGGERPKILPANVKIFKWIPQNDLLGHPKTKAFITHGGSNGLYEAIYHGVPVVGIPMFAEQPDNVFILEKKGAAVMLDYYTMESKDLVDGLNAVINNPLYKESMMRLSRLHHDQPQGPLERAMFWTEFVMRNKGAKHLRLQSHHLTWYQYYCLDVALFLLAVGLLVSWLILRMCCLSLRMCTGRGRESKRKAE